MPKAECWKIFGHQDCLHNCPRIKSMWICSGILIVVPSKCHHCRDQQRYDAHCLDWAECQASLKKKDSKGNAISWGSRILPFFGAPQKRKHEEDGKKKKYHTLMEEILHQLILEMHLHRAEGVLFLKGIWIWLWLNGGSIHAKNPHSTQKKKGSHPPCKVS